MPIQIYQLLVAICLAAIPITTVILASQIIVVTARAMKGRQHRIAVEGALVLIALAGSLAIVVSVWFIYAVSHGPKDVGTDLRLLAYTCVPFYLIAAALSRLVRHWRRVLARSEKAGPARTGP